MTWNYRILVHEHKKEILFTIHEVYYDENDIPNGYTENGVSINGEDISEISWVLEKMKISIEKPILYAGEKFPQEYKK